MRLAAPAKINLTLEVLGRLPGGYHELDTAFAWLEWADDVELEAAAETTLEMIREGEGGLPVGSGEDNLALKAVRLLEAELERPLGLRVRLTKRLPAGAGLGGGSADAAAVLVGANRLLGLGCTPARLQELAARLGSDVAFGIEGGAARGRGRGEQLEPLPDPPACQVVVVQPPFGLSTAEVYRAWDADPVRVAPGATERMARALAAGQLEEVARSLANDLEPPAVAIRPELCQLREAMREAGCQGVLLSGSGSCMFGLIPAEEPPHGVASRLEPYGRVVVTRFKGSRETG